MNFIRKSTLAVAVAVVAMALIAPAAMAGVQLSNHDMVEKYGAGTSSGTCSFCHIPHKAGGDKLWARTYSTTASGWTNETISALCFSCHDPASTIGTEPRQANPFGTTNKHQRTVATLTGSGLGGGDIASLPGTVTPNLSGDGDLKCTTCHDVHNNNNRPFIRYAGGTTGVFNFDGHCMECHPLRANGGQGTANTQAAADAASYSQHPTAQGISDTGVGGANAIQGTIDAIFATSPGTANLIGESGYNTGGHRTDGGTGNMTCASCHAVHGNETATFSSATDGTTPVVAEQTGYNDLLVNAGDPSVVGIGVAPICIGCHVNDATAGPGGAATLSHPTESSSPWGITGVDTATMGAKWGINGAEDVLVCQTCHKMHYAEPDTSILFGSITAPIDTSNSNCNECHSASTMANHHPANVAVVSGTDYVASAITHTTADNWAAQTRGTAGPAYAFPGGEMVCGTCHGSGAHNNATWPGLVGFNGSSEMCVDCHSYNPSVYTDNASASAGASAAIDDASHFVTTIASTGYQRAAAWSSGATSKYGDTANALICESCHTLRLTGVTPAVSDNTAVATVISASVGLLVEAAGNNQTVFDASGATPPTGVVDLCTGCHGGTPGGGSTHPVLANMGATTASAAIVTTVGGSGGTVTLTGGDQVNCESCHRPHDASSGSGALILEHVGTASTKVLNDRATSQGGANYADEADFCNMCHAF
jgi:hypothetical protein